MHRIVLTIALAVWGTLGAAKDDGALDKCAQTEAWFLQAIEARQDGQPKNRVRRALQDDMGRTAAEQLVDFVFTLPQAVLSPDLAKTARTQCEGL